MSFLRSAIQHCIGVATLLALLGIASPVSGQDDGPRASSDDYQKVSGVSGNLSSVGSDTLATLMTLWADEFKHFYPNVNVQVQATGSSSAPPALTQGTANLGPMSRLMKDKEIAAFENRYGYPPTPVAISVDALSVFVHRDNPVRGLTIKQLDAIFSTTRNCGAGTDISHWNKLGQDGRLGHRQIQLYGRNSVSGTYGYFKQHGLCNGDFKNNLNELPGSASVVQSVAGSLAAIGFSSAGYLTTNVKPVPLARSGGDPYVFGTAQNAVSGDYPLARFLYLYINKPPNNALSPLVREFLRLVLSRQGQDMVTKSGYIPLPRAIAQQEINKINNSD